MFPLSAVIVTKTYVRLVIFSVLENTPVYLSAYAAFHAHGLHSVLLYNVLQETGLPVRRSFLGSSVTCHSCRFEGVTDNTGTVNSLRLTP